jgi:hypothetical protein
MPYWQAAIRFLVFCAVSISLPLQLNAATATHKVVFTFGGLNERSGVLFVCPVFFK